jgi:hypothetical protein
VATNAAYRSVRKPIGIHHVDGLHCSLAPSSFYEDTCAALALSLPFIGTSSIHKVT